MATRADLGAAWDDIVYAWYCGTVPAVDPATGWEALGVVERLWAERLDVLLAQGGKGTALIVPVVELGVTLGACEKLPGFEEVLRRVRHGEVAALSEVALAAALVQYGHQPVFGPKVGGSRLDIGVLLDGQQVYIEVVTPELSDAMRTIFEGMKLLANTLMAQNEAASIDVYLVGDPTKQTREVVIERVRAMAARGAERVDEIAEVAFVRYQPYRPELDAFRPVAADEHAPILGVASVRLGAGIGTRVNVNVAMSDDRAHRFIAAELHHFSPDECNVLAMDVSRVPNGIRAWAPLIERCFQPARNRRVGAVVLHSGATSGARFVRRWRVLQNRYAYRPVPGRLLDDIARLNAGEG